MEGILYLLMCAGLPGMADASVQALNREMVAGLYEFNSDFILQTITMLCYPALYENRSLIAL